MCLHSAMVRKRVQAVRDNLAVDETELRDCPLLLLADDERGLVEELEAAIPTKPDFSMDGDGWISEGVAVGVENPAAIRELTGELAFEVRNVVGAEIIADKIDRLAALSRIADALVSSGEPPQMSISLWPAQ
jgi:hypothetical protein